jgi:ABC-type multidrug transport system ATPase subunit
MSVVVLQDVSKSFGPVTVLERFSARFGPGVHLLVGANGSGKSTLLNLVAGVLDPDAGEVSIDAQRGEAAKLLAFLAPPDAPAIPWLTGRRFIAFAAALFPTFRGTSALSHLAPRLGLEPFLDVALGDMSSGTARKVLLAAAWLSGAPVLLLDEPTNELDTASLEAFVDLLASEPARTVIVATHLVDAFARLSPAVLALEGVAPVS